MSGPEEAAAAVLEAREISVRFRGEAPGGESTTALSGVSLALHGAESLGVIGASGSGKTTLALCCAGLLSPTAGRVLHCGRDVYRHRRLLRGGRASLVQMVFQNPLAALDPRLPVGDWLSFVWQHRRGGAVGGLSGIAETLDLVRLPARVTKALPGQLSGGECQRVCIGAAVLAGAQALVLDEPVSMLDSLAWQSVVKVLGSIQVRLSMAYLVVSHDLRFVAELCGQVIVLAQGKIVDQGPTPEVYLRPRQEITRRLVAFSRDPIAEV